MAKVLVDQDYLEDGLELICGKIRLKTGGSGLLAFPVEIAQAVESLDVSGIIPTGTKEITENGEGIDVAAYAAVDVAVPTGITPTGTKQITSNGTGIDVTNYAAVDVAVPTGITPTGKKTITSNGDNIDVASYATVKVNVPQGITPAGTKTITANGTGIDVTNYAAVDVAVPAGSTTGIKTAAGYELTVTNVHRSGSSNSITVSLSGVDASKVVGIVIGHKADATFAQYTNYTVLGVTAMKSSGRTDALLTVFRSAVQLTGNQYVVFSASDVVITAPVSEAEFDVAGNYEAYAILSA